MTTSIKDLVQKYTESQLVAVIEVLKSFDVKEWVDDIMENGLCGAPSEVQYLLEHVMKVRSGGVDKDKENDDTQYCDMVDGKCENCGRLSLGKEATEPAALRLLKKEVINVPLNRVNARRSTRSRGSKL